MALFSGIQNLTISGSIINFSMGNQTFSGHHVNTIPTSGNTTLGGYTSTPSAYNTPEDTQGFPGLKALPRLTTQFKGRQDILQQMSRFFDRSQTSVALRMQLVFVLYGLGGAGKTQLMLKFVDDHSDQFWKIYFIDASTTEAIQSCLINIARDVRAGDTVDDALRWLCQQRQEWLLLFDNADEPNVNLRSFMPNCKHGNIIITSRNRSCRRYAPRSNYHVSGMRPEDAIELLLESAVVEPSEKNRMLCSAIAHELGYLALAIAQAGAYISQTSCLDEYLQIFKVDRHELLQEYSVQSVDDYAFTVYTTWEMSLKKLTAVARTFLRLCAFLHYDGISKAMFQKAAENDPIPEFQDGINFLSNFRTNDGQWSDRRFLDVVRELTSFSLIDVDEEGKVYSLHPLVHAWARDRAGPSERSATRSCIKQIIALSIDFQEHAESYSYHRSLLPHIDRLCEGGDDPKSAERFGLVYFQARRWNDAERLEKLAVEDARLTFGNEHLITLNRMCALALTYTKQGQLNKAEKLSKQILQSQRKIFGDEHPTTIIARSLLANIYRAQGRLSEAEKLDIEVLGSSRRILGDEHPDTLASMACLANTYWQQNRLEEAEGLHVRLLEVSRKVLGDGDLVTMNSMTYLADIYRRQGRWTEAEKLTKRAVKSYSSVFGGDHPDTVQNTAWLAYIYRSQNRFEEAERVQVDVVERSKRILGETDRLTVRRIAELDSLRDEIAFLKKKTFTRSGERYQSEAEHPECDCTMCQRRDDYMTDALPEQTTLSIYTFGM